MQQFVDSIRYSVATKNWFSALFMALAVPDICAALEHGSASGQRYKDWFNRYLKPTYNPDIMPGQVDHKELLAQALRIIDSNPLIGVDPRTRAEVQALHDKTAPGSPTPYGTTFTADDCYKFRCKSLHQGLAEMAGGRKIKFSPPPQTGTTIHSSSVRDYYVISIDVFCEDICVAVEQWLLDSASNTTIQQRLAELMTLNLDYLTPSTQ